MGSYNERMNEPACHVLLVDDDPEIRSLVADYLQQHGLTVTTVADGRGMRAALAEQPADILLLDIMLPEDDGLTLCREIRATRSLPIILLTALAEESDRVVGLEMGADDYLVKPFSPRELLARIRAVLRRSRETRLVHAVDDSRVYRFSGWSLSPGRRELFDPEGVLVTLTAGEFDLMLAFVRNAQMILNRDQLLELTKGRTTQAYDRSVDVQLSRLRRKLKNNELIKTVRGGGYLLTAEVQRE
jgi:two-component system OmpR family response regulator